MNISDEISQMLESITKMRYVGESKTDPLKEALIITSTVSGVLFSDKHYPFYKDFAKTFYTDFHEGDICTYLGDQFYYDGKKWISIKGYNEHEKA